jgi:hypothetical protein
MCCGYGMFILDPDFHPYRIKKKKQEGGKIFSVKENYFIFEMLKKKKFGPVMSLSSENINLDPEKTYSGSGSRGKKAVKLSKPMYRIWCN